MSGAATGRQKEGPDQSSRAGSSSPRSALTQASDEKLIGRCLQGDQEAWSALIDKYKNLIYSIPIKLGMHQDAGDIFQSVCVDLLSELPRLREHRALPKWLMQTCYHTCLRYQRTAERLVELPEDEHGESQLAAAGASDVPGQLVLQLEQEQVLREAISQLPEKCERMVRLLFFEFPPRPYEDVAEDLGMATGSIGAIRGRCLAYLKKQLEKRGFF
ncbi:MAG TPA: sigma-70 family RNA polymerase sigma factor [Terriglobales bacterium]|jgi:RNA polymerase sigma factor (sigma-70 family)|nr:sigma-70 family RNA polymerase sigma factor [Terriglobales bacterium]